MLERRINRSPIQYRSTEDSTQPGTISGYINKFDSDSEDLGGFIERIRPGAFAKSLLENDVVALINHDHSSVVGRMSSGTLRLKEDADGLYYEIDLPDTQPARDLRTLVARGDLIGCSFGFGLEDQDMVWSKRDGVDVCEIKNLNLVECSIGVTFPAYSASTMALRDRRNQDRKKSRWDAKIEIQKRMHI